MFHDLEKNRSHYNRVVREKQPLYFERFDRRMLEKRPRVRELVTRVFAAHFPEPAGDLLDLGCGTGFYFPLLSRHTERLIGVDVSETMLEIAQQVIDEYGLDNCQVRQGSALELDFADASFDVVHSWDFLHHVPDVAGALAEIARVLKPGGRYIALEPNLLNPSITWYHLRRRSEWRLFTQNQFVIPRRMRDRFDVHVAYDNTIISFLDERTWWLWNAIDRVTSIAPLHLLSFRYTLVATKQ